MMTSIILIKKKIGLQ